MKRIKAPGRELRGDFLWNMAGNLMFAAHSVLMLAFVSRFAGVESAGIFSLVYSVAQMLYLISCFELINVLITDSGGTIGFRETVVFRILTNGAMVVCAAVFAWAQGFTGLKAQAFWLLIGYMVLLSFAELSECQLHHRGYLRLSGKSLALDIGLCSLVFALMLMLTGSMLPAIGAMCAVILLWILFFDLPHLRATRSGEAQRKIRWNQLGMLVSLCLPLVCMRLIVSYVINSPKLAIDAFLTLRDQSVYGYMLMPASCINLLNLFVLRPSLPRLAQFYNEGQDRAFLRVVGFLVGWNVLVTVCVLAGGWVLGIPVLSLFYGVDLQGFRGLLCLCLLGGCFYSFATLFDAVATAMRCHRWNLFVYLPALLAGFTMTYSLVRRLGLRGAALSYVLLMAILAAGSGIVLTIFFLRHRRAALAQEADI